MELSIDQNESTVLQQVLSQYLSDLRSEIAGTESYDMRQNLKQQEQVIGKLLSKLSGGKD